MTTSLGYDGPRPTVASTIAAGADLSAHCRDCRRVTPLDLAALPAACELLSLPLVCAGCGSRRFGVTVCGARLRGPVR